MTKTAKPRRKSQKSAITAQSSSKQPAGSKAEPVHKPDAAATRKKRFGRRRNATPYVQPAKLPNVLRISQKSLELLWLHRRLFLGIVGVYSLLNLVLVRGFSGFANLSPLKDVVEGGNVQKGMELFGALIDTANTSSSDAIGVIQTCLLIITSLAIIWALRQVMAGEKVRIRDGFYKGMFPLVPVLLVCGVIILEFLPLVLGGFLYALVVGNGIAKNLAEILPWGILYFGGLLLTLYLVTTSVIAVYIATLPDMTPLKALRSAKNLVRYRHWSVLRKLLFLPFAMMLLTLVIMLPVLLWLTPLASWVFFALSMLGIVVVHAYLYTLYRELIA